MSEKRDLTIRVAGEGGEGVVSTGDFMTAACARAGLEVYTFKTFPAEVKGGYCLFQMRTSDEPVYNQGDSFDVFVAFNGEAYELNKHLLVPGTVLVWDGPGGDFEPEIPEGVISYAIPMTQTSKELGSIRSKNMVALGAVSTLFNVNEDTLIEVLTNKFEKKGADVLGFALKSFEAGKKLGQSHEKTDPYAIVEGKQGKDNIVIAGNEACGLGGILGGLEFFSAYPITPATEVAKYVSAHIPKTGGTLIQAEDEIASLAQVLGASYAGKRSMTSTSGPGLALMSELIGMATMSETPCLIIDVQRGGPSTGLPTKHEQSDLFLAVHGGHGDSPRIVMSVENVKDCIHMTAQALNIAEKYQSPVILCSDGSLAFSTQTVERPNPNDFEIINRKRWDGKSEYKRYEFTDDLISPMCDPGVEGGEHVATGLEHTETGAPNFTPEWHERNADKRFDKLKPLIDDLGPQEVDGDRDEEVDVGIISWGSTIGVVREAIQRLRAEGVKVKGFYPKLMYPMPVKEYEAFASKCKKILVPEVNYQGQLSFFIRAETSIDPIPYTICGGLPFTPAMIVDKVKEINS